MSAFVLGSDQYLKAAAAIRAMAYAATLMGHERLRAFHNNGDDYNGIDNAIRLAYALNRKAVSIRYRGEWQGHNLAVKQGIHRRVRVKPTPEIAFNVLKFLNCALYQMSEGSVYESKGFKHIEKLRDIVQMVAIENSPQYNAAPWAEMKITSEVSK